ncbi:surfeit locus protein 1-like [Arabidopsis lyrata subsp. lyrata]|nr:surfeit locus protein 1-like [Arabidopsis lyrata subsp. lyrata]|eukprot:XP_020869579.1 surfeit locus protein 1-like [Arabidopsis lyrata subsp. lyrata]
MSSSTTSNLPATSNLETQLLSSVPPPAKKKRGSALLWYLVGFTTYGLGETYKFLQTDLYKEHLDFRRQCLETKPMKLNTMKNVDELGFRRVVYKGVYDEQRSIYVGPKPRSMSKGSEDGFYVSTPLLPIPNEPNRHWSSLTCFIKASSILMRKLTKSDPIGIEPILITIRILVYICTKILW